MSNFAVIDTETNWADQVMSIGTAIVEEGSYTVLDSVYHILPIECQVGGMYEHTLFIETPVAPVLCTRQEAIAALCRLFEQYGVDKIFAYNACFDRNHLPELRHYTW